MTRPTAALKRLRYSETVLLPGESSAVSLADVKAALDWVSHLEAKQAKLKDWIKIQDENTMLLRSRRL